MKKKILFLIMPVFCFCLFAGQNYDNAPVKYTDALFKNKTPAERIKALKQFILEFPDTTNMYVKLAHYQLAVNSFQNKDYQAAIQFAEKRTGMGAFGEGEEARLYLVLGNAYAIKKNPLYNRAKAIGHIKKAMNIARASEDDQIFDAARQLLIKVNEPETPQQTPLQKFKQSYADEGYAKAAETYKTLSKEEKAQRENRLIYSSCLYRLGKLEDALNDLNQLYAERKEAKIAVRIAQIYSDKSSKNNSFLNQAAQKYVEAGLLYENEKEYLRRDKANQQALVQLQKKYKYKEQYDKVQRSIKQNQNASEKNSQEIRKVKSRLREINRSIRNDYPDIDPPQYLTDEQNRLEKRLEVLESGAGDQNAKDIEKLEALRKSIESELVNLKRQLRKQFQI